MTEMNFYKSLLAGESMARVVEQAARIPNLDFTDQVNQLSGNEITQFGVFASKKIQLEGVRETVFLGCLLFMQKQLTARKGCEGVLDGLIESIGKSRTQSFRSIPVFRNLVPVMAETPGIIYMFNSESSKIVCAENYPGEARDEAFERARGGEFINIKLAKAIGEKHSVANSDNKLAAGSPANNPIISPKTKRSTNLKREKSTWSYVGSVVRLVVEPKQLKSKAGLGDVISDLERLLVQLRAQYADSINNLKNVG